MFELKFETGNAVFEEAPEAELYRIMDRVVGAIGTGRTEGKVVDSNGNTIGEWKLS